MSQLIRSLSKATESDEDVVSAAKELLAFVKRHGLENHTLAGLFELRECFKGFKIRCALNPTAFAPHVELIREVDIIISSLSTAEFEAVCNSLGGHRIRAVTAFIQMCKEPLVTEGGH